MSDIKSTLAERGGRYGNFYDHARSEQQNQGQCPEKSK